MFNPFTVTATDPDTGKILAEKDVSDSHEREDVEKQFREWFPLAKIESRPR